MIVSAPSAPCSVRVGHPIVSPVCASFYFQARESAGRAEAEAGRKDFVALLHAQLVSPAEDRTVVFLLQGRAE